MFDSLVCDRPVFTVRLNGLVGLAAPNLLPLILIYGEAFLNLVLADL